MDKLRVTMRSGRIGSASHNDRSFLKGHENDLDFASHIDRECLDNNSVIAFENGKGISLQKTGKSLEELELEYYKSHYSDSLNRTNENYIKQGHKNRCKTIEDVYKGRLTKPEEIILQIGNKDTIISPEEFKKCVVDYIAAFHDWNIKNGNHGHILSISFHYDETSPHAHIRRVWNYEKDGLLTLGQNQGLKQAGIELPNPNEKEGRFNNRKITFDKMMRDKWIEICERNGFEVEKEPRPNKRHKEKAEYIAEQLQAEIDNKQYTLDTMHEELLTAEIDLNNIKMQTKAHKNKQKALKDQNKALEGDIRELRAEKGILTRESTLKGSESVKESMMHPNYKLVPNEFYEQLVQSSMLNEKSLNSYKKQKRKIKEIETDAQRKADEIIKDAKRQASNFDVSTKLAILSSKAQELDRIKEIYPELFQNKSHESKNIDERY